MQYPVNSHGYPLNLRVFELEKTKPTHFNIETQFKGFRQFQDRHDTGMNAKGMPRRKNLLLRKYQHKRDAMDPTH